MTVNGTIDTDKAYAPDVTWIFSSKGITKKVPDIQDPQIEEPEEPWEPDDPVVKPLNVYGQAKYDGEVAVEKYAPKHYICTYCMGIWT